MRITRDSLIKAAKNTVSYRTLVDKHLVAIYLTGSILTDEPLLGGTTDIDLVFVHADEPAQAREVVRMTAEVHLDIAHYAQSVYHPPRHLRLDPWIGTYLCQDPIMLHDTRHWFEFTQASVFDQFYYPENILNRARPLAEAARQTWFELQMNPAEFNPRVMYAYLKGLERAANSIAILSGAPLTERRFMLDYAGRTSLIDRPGLHAGLSDLIGGADHFRGLDWEAAMPQWQAALAAVSQLPDCPLRLDACRHAYYIRAAAALRPDHPEAAAWITLRTWTEALNHLSPENSHLSTWQAALAGLGFDSRHFEEQLKGLDAYLDGVEETLDTWAKKNGIEG